MALPTILIIEPEMKFCQNLSRRLREFGFSTLIKTDIIDLDSLFDVKIPVHSIVINLKLKNNEGLTVYSYIKNRPPFRETTFSFLADNKDIFCLMENMPLERGIVLHKEVPTDELVTEIINNVPLTLVKEAQGNFTTDLVGSFSEIPLEDILSFCKYSLYNGKLILNNKNDFAIIDVLFGDVTNVHYKAFSRNEALQELKTWINAGFRLERAVYTTAGIKDFLSKAKDTTVGKKFSIELKDILSDLFYFLHQFLAEQMAKYEVDAIFDEEFHRFKMSDTTMKNIIEFYSHSEEKVMIDDQVQEENVPNLIDLFKKIFIKAQNKQNELELTDLIDFLGELEPYLREINFYELVMGRKGWHQEQINPSVSTTISEHLITY